jgi:hypothetical protein
MADQEKTLDYLESQIPILAIAAMTLAYWQTLAAGLSVVVCHDGAIYENFPDGTRRFIKEADPLVHVSAGMRSEIS